MQSKGVQSEGCRVQKVKGKSEKVKKRNREKEMWTKVERRINRKKGKVILLSLLRESSSLKVP